MSLSDIAGAFSTWPGEPVYHLLVLFAIEAIVGLAISHGRRHGWSRFTTRVLQAGLAWSVGRALLVLAALIAWFASIPAEAILPLLERFVDISSLGFLVWAFVPLWGQPGWASYALALGNPIVAFVLYAFFAPRWYASAGQGAKFNGSALDFMWSGWGLLLAGVAIAGMLLGRRQEQRASSATRGAARGPVGAAWGYILVIFVFIFAGYLLHLFFYDSDMSTAAWTRLVYVVVYPMLVGIFYQQVIWKASAPHVSVGGADAVSLAALVEPGTMWATWAALHLLIESTDGAGRTKALQKAAEAMAGAMNIKAIALGIPADSPDKVELVAIHCLGEAPVLGRIFQLETQPAIQRAITRKQGSPLNPESGLIALLGSPSLGSLWIEPIIHGRQALGVIIAGKEKKAANWSPAEIQAIHTFATFLSSALNVTQSRERALKHSQDLSRQLADLSSRLTQSQASTDSQLSAMRTELQQSKAELYSARQQVTQYRKQVDDLAALVQLQDTMVQRAQQGQGPSEEAWVSIQKLSDLLVQRHELENQVAEWQLETARLILLQEALEEQLKRARQQIVTFEEWCAAQSERSIPVHVAATLPETKSRPDLINWLAQELRSLIASIDREAALLAEPHGAHGQSIGQIHANIKRLQELLDGLLVIGNIEPLLFRRQAVNAAELVQEWIAGADRHFKLDFDLDIAADAPSVNADRDSLAQAISFLMSNACQCSQPNSQVAVRLRKASDRQDDKDRTLDYLLLSVSDTGGGIIPEDIARVFDYARRADHLPIKGLGDTGMGLFVAKMIVEVHRGRAWVDSELGVGSTFTVLLPTHTGHENQDGEDGDQT